MRAIAKKNHKFIHETWSKDQAREFFSADGHDYIDEALSRGALNCDFVDTSGPALRQIRAHLETLGSHVGAFDVRDWFWERVATCADAASFVALQGLGLEGANLEHSARFAADFRAAGDARGAEILEQVEHDEIGHVRFAVHWFEALTGAPLDYDRWAEALPRPLTPAVLQGRPLNREARRAAGLDEPFLSRLVAEPATTARSAR